MPIDDHVDMNAGLPGHVDTWSVIKGFVNTMNAVPIDMIYRYLPSFMTIDQVEKMLHALGYRHDIYVDWPDRMVYSRNYNKNRKQLWELEQQQNVIRAGWVLCSFGCQNIQYLHCSCFPVQLKFATTSCIGLDLTVINPINIDFLKTELPKYWALHLPEGIPDSITHIAVMPDASSWENEIETLQLVKKIGFAMKATLDPETHDATLSKITESGL